MSDDADPRALEDARAREDARGREDARAREDAGRELPLVLVPLRDRASESALFLDYDGTLAPIVDDPAHARPLPGTADLLVRLASRLGLVAVVSGRPVEYLLGALGRPAGVCLIGLYGMEEITADGSVWRDPAALAWSSAVERGADAARASVPDGAEVEEKGLSVTLHWRRAPRASGWAQRSAQEQARRTGLVVHQGRMAVELRPPVRADKGVVVERLAEGFGVVGFFGDDVGDLPAFAALGRLQARGTGIARVAVADDESVPEVLSAADLVVRGPEEVLRVLEAILGETGGRRPGGS